MEIQWYLKHLPVSNAIISQMVVFSKMKIGFLIMWTKYGIYPQLLFRAAMMLYAPWCLHGNFTKPCLKHILN
ncbi:uncharacterized protein METZ01_LOCUS516672 [marine metagenome]|uniref:Uncharacterized protein n=1 Tax=marine metagenome TaxID=408172 RepID=A0A383F620_9ZZZZ